LNAHLASYRGLELDHALRHRRRMRSDQLDKRRLGRFLSKTRNSAKPLLQLHIIQSQWVSNRIQTVLPRQFYRSFPKLARQSCPLWPGVSKLLKLALQLSDWLGDGRCAFSPAQCQPTSPAD